MNNINIIIKSTFLECFNTKGCIIGNIFRFLDVYRIKILRYGTKI